VDGLLRDKTRPPRIPSLGAAIIEQVVGLTLSDPPGETTHWTAVAKATGISVSSVQRIWPSHGLQPHRMRQLEGFFAGLTKRRLKRGVFHSLVSLQEAINRFVAEANTEPKPFHWAKDPDTIIAAVRRGHQVLDYSG
jgi:hypothetical protein